MKRFLIVIIVLVILSSLAFAKLSDETLLEVEKLRWKHSGELISFFDCEAFDDSDIVWNRPFLSMWVEGDKLIVETQDGTWFIEMEKMTE